MNTITLKLGNGGTWFLNQQSLKWYGLIPGEPGEDSTPVILDMNTFVEYFQTWTNDFITADFMRLINKKQELPKKRTHRHHRHHKKAVNMDHIRPYDTPDIPELFGHNQDQFHELEWKAYLDTLYNETNT